MKYNLNGLVLSLVSLSLAMTACAPPRAGLTGRPNAASSAVDAKVAAAGPSSDVSPPSKVVVMMTPVSVTEKNNALVGKWMADPTEQKVIVTTDKTGTQVLTPDNSSAAAPSKAAPVATRTYSLDIQDKQILATLDLGAVPANGLAPATVECTRTLTYAPTAIDAPSANINAISVLSMQVTSMGTPSAVIAAPAAGAKSAANATAPVCGPMFANVKIGDINAPQYTMSADRQTLTLTFLKTVTDGTTNATVTKGRVMTLRKAQSALDSSTVEAQRAQGIAGAVF